MTAILPVPDAQQQLNSMVRDLTSSEMKIRIIHVITVIGGVFAVFSILGSAYGIYFDMLIDYGHTPSLIAGATIGLTIEAVKMIGVWGFFNYPQLHLKLIFFTLLSVFTTFAILLHPIGATNMEVTKRIQIMEEIQSKNTQFRLSEDARKNKIVNMMEGVLNNGTSIDDKVAAKTVADIDKETNSLYAKGKISELDMMQIQEVRDGARKRANSMRTFLPVLEIFSIFGFLGAYLKTQSVSGGTRDIIKTMDAYREKEGTMNFLADTAKTQEQIFVDNIKHEMEKNFNQKHQIANAQPPTETAAEMLMRIYGVSEEELKQKISKANQEPQETIKLETRFEKPSQVEEKVDSVEFETEPIFIDIDQQQVRALDYKAYNEDERKLLLLMFDNGDILPDEHLVKRTAIIAEAKGELGIKNAGEILTALNGKLLDKGYIESTPRGYKAKSALSKDLWQPIE
jgi:hypothetical protein